MGSRAHVAWEVKYISRPRMVSVQLEEPFGSSAMSSLCPSGSRAGSLLLFMCTGTVLGWCWCQGTGLMSCRDLSCCGRVSAGCE